MCVITASLRCYFIADPLKAWGAEFTTTLTSLDLSNNVLTTLKGQGLGYLKALSTLDLRSNALSSLPETLVELSKCGKLSTLFLRVRLLCVCVECQDREVVGGAR